MAVRSAGRAVTDTVIERVVWPASDPAAPVVASASDGDGTALVTRTARPTSGWRPNQVETRDARRWQPEVARSVGSSAVNAQGLRERGGRASTVAAHLDELRALRGSPVTASEAAAAEKRAHDRHQKKEKAAQEAEEAAAKARAKRLLSRRAEATRCHTKYEAAVRVNGEAARRAVIAKLEAEALSQEDADAVHDIEVARAEKAGLVGEELVLGEAWALSDPNGRRPRRQPLAEGNLRHPGIAPPGIVITDPFGRTQPFVAAASTADDETLLRTLGVAARASTADDMTLMRTLGTAVPLSPRSVPAAEAFRDDGLLHRLVGGHVPLKLPAAPLPLGLASPRLTPQGGHWGSPLGVLHRERPQQIVTAGPLQAAADDQLMELLVASPDGGSAALAARADDLTVRRILDRTSRPSSPSQAQRDVELIQHLVSPSFEATLARQAQRDANVIQHLLEPQAERDADAVQRLMAASWGHSTMGAAHTLQLQRSMASGTTSLAPHGASWEQSTLGAASHVDALNFQRLQATGATTLAPYGASREYIAYGAVASNYVDTLQFQCSQPSPYGASRGNMTVGAAGRSDVGVLQRCLGQHHSTLEGVAIPMRRLLGY